MKIWFSADTHFGHEKIIKYTNRPFKNVKHMDESLIKRWNDVVNPEDIIYFLGDFCFKNDEMKNKAEYYKNKLNGNIVFIRGNHDWNNGVKTHIENCLINIGNKKDIYIYLTHNPKDYEPNVKLNFCGHIHNNWKFKEEKDCLIVNVGVDVNNFFPVSYKQIMKEYRRFKK